MNHTENYNLGLPLVTEKYDVSVFNTNYTIIDAQLKSNSDIGSLHVNNKQNPHEVTAAQVGLGNVDNTSDMNKPVSNAQSQAIASAVGTERTRAMAAEQANATAIENIRNSLPGIATTEQVGLVKPDGSTITIEEDGTISATQQVIDSALSESSPNPVQNAVVTTALNSKANQATTYTKTEVDNLFSSVEMNIDWKETVNTYADIATTYPNPLDGWTVNVKDTDYTYRYDGTSWVPISANAIPDATTSVKGLMTTAMVTKLNGIEAGAQVNTVTGVKGDAENSYRTGNINITKANIGLDNVENVAVNDAAPTFTQASTRTNIVSGEKLSILFGKIMKWFADLKTVAFSGSYNDLSDRPTVGNATLTIQKNGTSVKTFTANATADVTANITVPTKTSDLTNDSGFITSSSLPTVNNATLTIQKNGTNVQTFTANQGTDATANITVPTKTSELTNDSGFTTNVGTVTSVATGAGLTGGTITGSGTLKAKMKSETKSSLTAADKGSTADREYAVGLDASGNLSVNVPWQNSTYTVNNGTLTIKRNGSAVQTFSANQSSSVEANITVPTKVSELTNDSGYTTNTGTVTSVKVGSTSYSPSGGVVSLPAYLSTGGGTITGYLSAKFTNIDASKADNNVSSTQYPTTFNILDTADRILTRKEAIIESSGNISAYWYVRNYNTSGALVAQKGIKITMNKSGTTTYTVDDAANFRSAIGAGTSSFSGNYNDLTNKPTIPTVNNATLKIQKNGTDVKTFTANASSDVTCNITVPTKVSELTNDSGYTTNTGTVTSVKVGTTSYSPSSGVVSLPAYPTVNNATLTINQNGSLKASFTANSSSAATANIITDTWTSTALVNSDTVTFSGLDDSYGYDLYCQNKLISVTGVTKSGSGTSTTLTYTVSGAATGDVCKLRILK